VERHRRTHHLAGRCSPPRATAHPPHQRRSLAAPARRSGEAEKEEPQAERYLEVPPHGGRTAARQGSRRRSWRRSRSAFAPPGVRWRQTLRRADTSTRRSRRSYVFVARHLLDGKARSAQALRPSQRVHDRSGRFFFGAGAGQAIARSVFRGSASYSPPLEGRGAPRRLGPIFSSAGGGHRIRTEGSPRSIVATPPSPSDGGGGTPQAPLEGARLAPARGVSLEPHSPAAVPHGPGGFLEFRRTPITMGRALGRPPRRHVVKPTSRETNPATKERQHPTPPIRDPNILIRMCRGPGHLR